MITKFKFQPAHCQQLLPGKPLPSSPAQLLPPPAPIAGTKTYPAPARPFPPSPAQKLTPSPAHPFPPSPARQLTPSQGMSTSPIAGANIYPIPGTPIYPVPANHFPHPQRNYFSRRLPSPARQLTLSLVRPLPSSCHCPCQHLPLPDDSRSSQRAALSPLLQMRCPCTSSSPARHFSHSLLHRPPYPRMS